MSQVTQKFIKKHAQEHGAQYSDNKDKNGDKLLGSISLFLEFILNIIFNVLRALPISRHLVGPPKEVEAMINSLIAQQKVASSFEEWKNLSLQLDELLNNQKWKQELESDLYDYELIKIRTEQLRNTRLNHDYKKLLYLIRTTWTRNIGNIGNMNLYRHSLVGTKVHIEKYLEECELAVNCLLDDKVNTGLDDRYILGMLIQTRKAVGRTALVLSGGGCFGLIHIGVLSTLLEQDLLPKVVSGSSAGAIVASILSVHNPEEIDQLLQDVMTQKFAIFSDSEHDSGNWHVNLFRFLSTGNWFDNAYLLNTMKSFLGDLTFREAHNRTGRILNVTVSPASPHEQPTLLNYITAPNVLISSAVCASCALPGVFPSTIIYEKDPLTGAKVEWSHISVRFVDGSVNNDLPITRLSEMFNINHIIACQVNPHVSPFLKLSLTCVGGEIEHEFSAKVKNYFNSLYNSLKEEVIHWLEINQEVGVATNFSKKITSVLTQQYSGDITILPDLRLSELGIMLQNPSSEFILDAIVRGARSTWPKLGIIKNHCFIEFLLDRAIVKLRTRLITKRVNLSGVSEAFVNSPLDSDGAVSAPSSSSNSEDDLTKETEFDVASAHPVRSNSHHSISIPIADKRFLRLRRQKSGPLLKQQLQDNKSNMKRSTSHRDSLHSVEKSNSSSNLQTFTH